ncbi:DNA-binding response regulator [Verrucomicrobia bacterium LW23]|nr:DNA-binding response regulator [Verrucomicrobia bacterium LW23]
MAAKTKILVVEDDPNIRFGLVEILEGEDFEVQVRERGDEALAALRSFQPDLLILDVMLPGMSGFEVCKAIRAKKNAVPILMLTAKGQEIDKVIGLETGADDYVTKPFGLRELLARIHALLRRSRTHVAATAASPAGRNGSAHHAQHVGAEAFKMGSVTVDPKRLEVRRTGAPSAESLTARELKLLQIFHLHSGEVLSRDRLLNEVWGIEFYGTTRTLDQTIAQLRKKLGECPEPHHLLTVHGVGYRWEP